MIDVIKEIVDDRPLRELVRDINAARDCAGRVAGIVRPVWIAMRMEENVSLDPGIRAVQIQVIIRGSVEDIIDHLQNGPGSLTARKVNRIVEAVSVPEVVIAEN